MAYDLSSVTEWLTDQRFIIGAVGHHDIRSAFGIQSIDEVFQRSVLPGAFYKALEDGVQFARYGDRPHFQLQCGIHTAASGASENAGRKNADIFPGITECLRPLSARVIQVALRCTGIQVEFRRILRTRCVGWVPAGGSGLMGRTYQLLGCSGLVDLGKIFGKPVLSYR